MPEFLLSVQLPHPFHPRASRSFGSAISSLRGHCICRSNVQSSTTKGPGEWALSTNASDQSHIALQDLERPGGFSVLISWIDMHSTQASYSHQQISPHCCLVRLAVIVPCSGGGDPGRVCLCLGRDLGIPQLLFLHPAPFTAPVWPLYPDCSP